MQYYTCVFLSWSSAVVGMGVAVDGIELMFFAYKCHSQCAFFSFLVQYWSLNSNTFAILWSDGDYLFQYGYKYMYECMLIPFDGIQLICEWLCREAIFLSVKVAKSFNLTWRFIILWNPSVVLSLSILMPDIFLLTWRIPSICDISCS